MTRGAASFSEGSRYDVFIVHAAADEAFVRGYLLDALGLPDDRVLRIQTIDLGEWTSKEIERGVESSRFTIVVLSPAFLDDAWAKFGHRLATHASADREGPGTLLPLLREDCGLSGHVDAIEKLDFRDRSRTSWEAEVQKLQRYLGRPVAPARELSCPYPGMRPFHAEEADRFFGRDLELDQIVDLLRRGRREICIVGPSGSGKSSLIAAGLVPRLAAGCGGLPTFHVESFRPGNHPRARLTAALGGEVTAPGVAPRATIDELLRRNAAASLLLVIDQLEELFTIADENERGEFLTDLVAVRDDPRIAIVFVLRADFYDKFLNGPEAWEEISRIDLRPLRGENLRSAIERPALVDEVYFERELVARLLAAADEPGALPLLQETLFQLWRRRRRRLLTLDDYHAPGEGARSHLAVAVEQHATDVLGRMKDPQRDIALRILLRLVAFGEGRANTRRQQPREALRSVGEAPHEFAAVLQCLVDNRLVTVSSYDDTRGAGSEDAYRDVRVDLAHEVLIHAWTQLASWVENERNDEMRRRDLEATASAWRQRDSKHGGLLDAEELANARAWRDRAACQLGESADLAALIVASEDAHRRDLRQRRRGRLVALAVPAVALGAVVAVLVARWALHQRDQRNLDVAESAQLYQDVGWQRLHSERPLQALPYFVMARQLTEASGHPPSESLRMLFALAKRNLPSPARDLPSHVLAVSNGGSRGRVVVVRDNIAQVHAASGVAVSPPLQHQGSVLGATFSPDHTRLVTGSMDWTARVWNAAADYELLLLLSHGGPVRSVAFSPDGTRIVTASDDGAARVWDALTGKLIGPTLQHRDATWCAVFDPGGTRIATAGKDGTVLLWDAATGAPIAPTPSSRSHTASALHAASGAGGTAHHGHDADNGRSNLVLLRHDGPVRRIAFSPDGLRIVTASDDSTARVWDAASGTPRSPPLRHGGPVRSAAFSRDGMRVVTAGDDRVARIWDAATGTPLSFPLEHLAPVTSAVFSEDGTEVVTSADRQVVTWDAPPAEPLTPLLLTHRDIVESAAFTADGTKVVTASDDGTVRIWDAVTGYALSPALEHSGAVRSAAFSADGQRVVTACGDGTARLWDAVSGAPLSLPLLHPGMVVSAAFSASGNRLLTISTNAPAVSRLTTRPKNRSASAANLVLGGSQRVPIPLTARVWDAAGKLLLHSLQHPQPDGEEGEWRAEFDAGGTRVVTISGNTARVWNAMTGDPVTPVLEHTGTVVSAAFSPDAARIVTTSGDNMARIWDASTGTLAAPPLVHHGSVVSAAFSSDGARVVTTSLDRTARVWDAATGGALSPPLEHQRWVKGAVFSPDGSRVVTYTSPFLGESSAMTSAGTVQLWDATTGKLLSPLPHPDGVRGAVFSASGDRMVTAGEDGVARVWSLPLDRGSLEDWRATVRRASPYSLANGVLSQLDAARELPVPP